MGIVTQRILDPTMRPTVIEECAALVDSEVAAKKGVTGMMIKTGYKAFKAIRPSMVETAVDLLLDDFAERLDMQYSQYVATYPDGEPPFDEWAAQRDAVIADDLLKVTDALMERSNKQAIKKIYRGLRNTAQRNVAQSVPAVARLVMKYA